MLVIGTVRMPLLLGVKSARPGFIFFLFLFLFCRNRPNYGGSVYVFFLSDAGVELVDRTRCYFKLAPRLLRWGSVTTTTCVVHISVDWVVDVVPIILSFAVGGAFVELWNRARGTW